MANKGSIITYQYPILGGGIGCSYTAKASPSYDWDIAKTTVSWSINNQNIATNETTIDWSITVQAYNNAGNVNVDEIYLWDATDKYNKETLFYDGDYKTVGAGSTVKVASGTFVRKHDINGNFTFPLSVRIYMGAGGYYSNYAVETTTSITLDTIPRKAVLLSAPNFTDEDSPTISYVVPNDITDVKACISFTGATDDIPYRDIEPRGSSYTFEFTTAEKLTFWNLLDQGITSTTVRFYIRSVRNGEIQFDYLTRTISLINYYPHLGPKVVDTNPKTLALTGNENIIVKYASTASFNSYAVARKNASIDTQYVKNGELIKYEAAGEIEGPTSNTFYFSVTDNRGYTTQDAVVFSRDRGYFIEYLKPTVSATLGDMNAVGEVEVTITGKYFDGTFGATTNALTVGYTLSENNEEPTQHTLGVVEPTMDGNDYTYKFTISNLNYMSVYEVSINVADKVLTDGTTTEVILASTPLFDWGEKDFNFNIPVQMSGGFMYPQTVLWQLPESPTQTDIDNALLGDGAEITLDKPISEQPTGIVLVFSLYRDGKVEDVSITSHFKSRVEIQYLMPYGKHTFLMAINSNLSVFGSKYVTITDDSISGFSGNTASGTASGSSITFDNSKFILRYVIGV